MIWLQVRKRPAVPADLAVYFVCSSLESNYGLRMPVGSPDLDKLLVYFFLKLLPRVGRRVVAASKPRLGADKGSKDFEPKLTKLKLLH